MIWQSRKKLNPNFFIKTVFLCCFALLAAIQAANAAETAANSTTSLSSGTKECELTDDNYKKIAEQANLQLIEMKKNYDEYEKSLNAMKKNDNTLVCFTPSELDFKLGDKQSLSGKASQWIKGVLTSAIDKTKIVFKNIANSDLKFNANDAAGAVTGAKYVPALQENFDVLDKELKDTHIDIKYHIENVNSARHEYISNRQDRKTEMQNAQTAEAIAVAEAHSLALEAKIEILTDCQKAFNNVMNYRRAFSASRDKAHQYLTTLSKQVESHCTCASTGELLSCEVKDDTFQEDDLNDAECKQLNEYEADFTICPICGIFETILKADQKLSGGAFEALSDSLINLLLLGFSIFIGYQVLILIASPAKQTIGKFLNTLLLQGFKVALAIGLLALPNTVYELGLTPLIESGFEFGLSLIPSSADQSVIEGFASKYDSFDEGNNLLTADFLKKVMGAVEGYNAKTSTFPAIGRSLYCNSWVNKTWYVLPHWQMLIEGVLIFAFGLMIMLAVGFYLLDIALHLGIIACLLPFLIACWPFKITSGYTKTGWNMILNVCFRFIIMGVLLASVIELIEAALTSGLDKSQLEEWLNSNNTDELEKAMSINGLQMLILLVCCMISMKLVSQLSKVTDRFASGGVPTGDMGSKLGGTAASVATAVAKPAAAKGAKAIASASGAMAEAAGVTGAVQAVGNKISTGAKNISGKFGIGSKAKIAGGRNAEDAEKGDTEGENKEESGGGAKPSSGSKS